MKLYSIFDTVSKRFNAPFVAESDEVANRSFQFGVKDNPFASDFDLYYVGIFDPESDVPFVCASPSLVSHFIGQVIENV